MMDTAFFVASKLGWAVLRIESWMVIGLAIGLWAVIAGRLSLARTTLSLTLGLLLSIGLLPLGDFMIRPLERAYSVPDLPASIDGIIVLGGAEEGLQSSHWQSLQLNDAAERITAAAVLARAYPDALVIVAGGSGRLTQLDRGGGNWVGGFLTDLGLGPDRLVIEGASRNTAENATLSHQRIMPAPGQIWVLVTSGYHMPRAMASFAAAGWTGVIAYPVDFRSATFRQNIAWDPVGHMHVANLALREHVGRLAYSVARK